MLEPVLIHCPYCGEAIEVLVEASGDGQRYVEDCQVCCRPIVLSIALGEGDRPDVRADREDDA